MIEWIMCLTIKNFFDFKKVTLGFYKVICHTLHNILNTKVTNVNILQKTRDSTKYNKNIPSGIKTTNKSSGLIMPPNKILFSECFY